jgi:hypothetical protein
VTYDGRHVYLVYVDNSYRLHLLWRTPDKEEHFKEVDLPELWSDTPPAVAGGVGDWLTIAFSTGQRLGDSSGSSCQGLQLLATVRDINRPSAWPTGTPPISAHTWPKSVDFGYWVIAPTWIADSAPAGALLRFDNDNILCWRQAGDWGVLHWRMARKWEDHYQESDPRYNAPRVFSTPNSPMEDVSLALCNGNIFLASRTTDSRIILQVMRPYWACTREGRGHVCMEYGPPAGAVDEVAWLLTRCQGKPSLACVELEGGAHPQLAVAYRAIDGRIRVRLLSMDTRFHALNYDNCP